MRIIADVVLLILGFLFEVLIEYLLGKTLGKTRKGSSTEPTSGIVDETVEYKDCRACGKPNPTSSASCRACGVLLETARS